MRSPYALAAAFAFLMIFPLSARAQVGTTTDIITGKVLNDDKQPLNGAKVVATSLESRISRSTITDSNGKYTIIFPDGGGRYQLRISYIGTADQIVTLAREADEDVLLANITMSINPIALQGIEVRAQRPAPGRGEAGSSGQSLSSELVERLPLPDNDPATLAQLTPGVVATTAGDSADLRNAFSVAGQRATQNSTTLDGQSFGSPLTGGGGGSPLGVPQEGLRSTNVITSSFDVARGQFAGGQVAMTTRGGTNLVQGTFNYTFQNPMLQGGGNNSIFGNGFTQQRLSGGVGGPLKRDKAFYFVSLATQRRTDDLFALTPDDPSTLLRLGTSPDSVNRFLDIIGGTYGIPLQGQTGAFDRTGNALTGLARFDFNLSERHSLMVRGNGTYYGQDSARIGLLELRQNGGETAVSGGGGMLSLTSRLGGSWINEAKVSFNNEHRHLRSYDAVPEGRVRVESILDDNARGITSFAFGGDRSLPTQTSERVFEASDELSFLFGDTHRLKLGTLFNHSGFTQQLSTNRFGTFFFNSLADFEARRPSSFSRSLSNKESNGGGMNAAAYLGDSWRPRTGIQLTYGVRLEASRFDGTPAYNPVVEQLFGRRTDNTPSEVHMSPRVGFTWRLGNTPTPQQIAQTDARAARADSTRRQGGGPRIQMRGRMPRIVRGGIGEFRGRAPFSLFASALDQTGLSNAETQLNCVGAAVPIPDWSDYRANPDLIPTQCANGAPSQLSGRLPNVTLFADDFAAPRSWRASLGLQTPLVSLLNGSVDLTYTRGVGLYGVQDLNLRSTPAFTLADEGSRPVYADPAGIVPLTGEISPTASRLHPEFGSVYSLTSALRSQSLQLTTSINGIIPPRIFMQVSYTLMRSRDESSFNCCSAQQGFSSPTTAGNPNTIEWSTSDFDRRHMFTALAGIPFREWLEITLIGRLTSGSPFTPIVGGDINGDGARNDRAFIFDPATAGDTAIASGMSRILGAVPGRVRECIEKQLGRIADRNSCRNGWSENLSLRASIKPQLPTLGRRLQIGVDVMNLSGGIDKLLHGSNLRGWGQPDRVDPTLLYPRGFDPATQRYRYQVNELFGQNRSQRFGFGAPFQLQITARLTLGASTSGGPGGLAGIAFGGMGGGMRGGGGGGGPRIAAGGAGGGPGGFDVNTLAERALPNPVPRILELKDSLKLSAEQVTRLTEISDSLRVKQEPLIKQAQDKITQAGRNVEMSQMFAVIGPIFRAGRENVVQAMAAVQKVLTPEQWQQLPENLRNSGGAGRFRF